MKQYTNFSELVEEKDYLIKTCIRRLNIYRDMEDFYQIGLIALYKAYISYDAKKDSYHNFDVYAYYIILNYMKNELTRQNARKQEVTYPDGQWEWVKEPENLEDLVTNKLFFEELMKQLTDEDRKIFNLKRLGFGNMEIAGILGLKFERVKYRLKCIYQLIRDSFDPKNQNPDYPN